MSCGGKSQTKARRLWEKEESGVPSSAGFALSIYQRDVRSYLRTGGVLDGACPEATCSGEVSEKTPCEKKQTSNYHFWNLGELTLERFRAYSINWPPLRQLQVEPWLLPWAFRQLEVDPTSRQTSALAWAPGQEGAETKKAWSLRKAAFQHWQDVPRETDYTSPSGNIHCTKNKGNTEILLINSEWRYIRICPFLVFKS